MAIKYVWDTDSAVINRAIVHQRKMYVVSGIVSSAGTLIYWTVDGSTLGSSLFSTDIPMVAVMIAQDESGSRIGNMGFFGPMIAQGKPGDSETYYQKTTWDASLFCWLTRIYRRGDPAANQSSGEEPGRHFWAVAIGRL